MSRGKRVTVEVLEKIITLSNAGLEAGKISAILDGVSKRSVLAYVDCIRAAERGEKELYSSKMIGEQVVKEYCAKHGLIAPVMSYFKKKKEAGLLVDQLYETFGVKEEKKKTKSERIAAVLSYIQQDIQQIKDILLEDEDGSKDQK